MEINKEHKIDDTKQFNLTKHKKRQIVLGHTGSSIDDFFTKVKTRYNKNYDKSSTYVIGLNGQVYEMFDPEYFSDFMEDDAIDRAAISIALENVGWLHYDPRDNQYYDWKGHHYADAVITKEWRNKKHWAAYTDTQVDSLIILIDNLCDRFKIQKVFVGDNITVHKPKTFKGIINRSNYNKNCYDLSPAMDFDKLNNRINRLPKTPKTPK